MFSTPSFRPSGRGKAAPTSCTDPPSEPFGGLWWRGHARQGVAFGVGHVPMCVSTSRWRLPDGFLRVGPRSCFFLTMLTCVHIIYSWPAWPILIPGRPAAGGQPRTRGVGAGLELASIYVRVRTRFSCMKIFLYTYVRSDRRRHLFKFLVPIHVHRCILPHELLHHEGPPGPAAL